MSNRNRRLSPQSLVPLSNKTEKWKTIRGTASRYMISNRGRVASLRASSGWRSIPRIMLQRADANGYRVVRLTYPDRKHRNKTVHRLVASAFVAGYAAGLEVNHIDGNKMNNSFDNLEWCTGEENRRHAAIMMKNIGANHGLSKLTDEDVLSIRSNQYRLTQQQLARCYGVSQATISAILRNRTWKHLLEA